MSNRVSRSMVEAAVKRLAAKCGKTFTDNPWRQIKGENRCMVGVWMLDHNSVYGGYVIEETVNNAGATTHPLLERRLSGQEMLNAVYMAERAFDMASKVLQEAR